MAYDNERDYKRPYHWDLQPGDLFSGGTEYWGYVRLAERLLQPLPKPRILEVGCGDGRICEHVAQRFPDARVEGIDISLRAIAFAQLCGGAATYRRISLYDLQETYDVVLLIEVLEHIPKEEIERFLAKIHDVLQPGGSLILSVPTPRFPMFHPGHVQHFDREAIVQLLERSHLFCREIIYQHDLRLDFRYHTHGLPGFLKMLVENRVWTLKPGRRLLRWVYERYGLETTEARAGRIVLRATRSEHEGHPRETPYGAVQ
jgi:2-polyprenyl-3-methyl-5-hydroxy-6-metoxy-1,4-benzoquinol methylase